MYKLVWGLLFIVSCTFTSENKNNAIIQFDKNNLDVGTIAYKSENEFKFRFRNVGTGPLKIESLNLSCTCLDAKWPKTEINPNDSGNIVIYANIGRLGRITDRIIVHHNGVDSPTSLFLSGNIVYKND